MVQPDEQLNSSNDSNISIKHYEFLLKEGYLNKCDVATKHPWNSSSLGYYVLKRSSFDCYKTKKCVHLKRSYPLAIIDEIKHLDDSDIKFSLIFSYQPLLVLQAESTQDCEEWIERLTAGAERWKCNNIRMNQDDEGVGHFNDRVVFPSQHMLQKVCKGDSTLQVHGECSMIKYARYGKTIPHERTFKVDRNYLHIMWKKARRTAGYRFKCCVPFNEVAEVRCGQQTRNFNLFPYVEVEKQSFSLMFERDQGEWCGLESLDLICDSVLAFQHWKQALEIIIYGKDEKLPLRDAHKLADPIEIYLKRHWSILTDINTISLDLCSNFMCQYNQTVGKRVLRNFIRDMVRHQFSAEQLNMDFFFFLFNLLNKQVQLYEYFKKYAKSFLDLGMTSQEFMLFLKQEQKMVMIDSATVSKLIEHHDKNNWIFKRFSAGDDPSAYQASANLLSFHGFVSFLRSADNSIVNSDSKQNMNEPLSDYFINSSHNTYLTGHQLKGQSSCESYVYALQQGCRCLEIDCWDGPEEPIVTHGMTLTSKIRLRDVLEIVKVYAFDSSPYPVILSLENHCSEEQQRIMANLFEEIFGEMLATENLCDNNTLPSPEQLKYKVILKGNPQTRKADLIKRTVRKISKQAGLQNRTYSRSEDLLPSVGVRPYRTSTCSQQDFATDEQKDDESVQIPLEASMCRLIVYCRAIPYKRNDLSQNCCEMYSFGENAITVLGERFPLDVLYFSRRKLLRVYPRGSRVDSSNYNPVTMWALGAQMASINMQKPDFGYHINAGFFRKSFGTGYVLKPHALINKGSTYHPKMSRNPDGENMETITLQIICGQFVDSQVFMNLPVSVEFETVGIEADCDCFTTEPCCGNTFNPTWEKNRHVFNIVMPSLCMLYVKVFAVSRVNKMIYQTCLPLELLNPGLRYIPLKTLTSVDRKENGLFVKLDIIVTSDMKRHQTELSSTATTSTINLHKRSRVYTM